MTADEILSRLETDYGVKAKPECLDCIYFHPTNLRKPCSAIGQPEKTSEKCAMRIFSERKLDIITEMMLAFKP